MHGETIKFEPGFSGIFVCSFATEVSCTVVHHEEADSSCNNTCKMQRLILS